MTQIRNAYHLYVLDNVERSLNKQALGRREKKQQLIIP